MVSLETLVALSPREIFLIVFVAGLAAFLYWDRRKVERHYILFYRRTKRGIERIDQVAKAAPRFWNYYGWAGVITGFVSIIAGAGLFLYGIWNMITTQSAESGPSLLLPGLVSENQFQAGVSFIPIEYWVVGIGILMFVHEMSHGVVARTEGFELNSVGWIVLGILPGAFVEPKGENMLPGDEANQDDSRGMWEGGKWTSRLKVLGAGSFANYLTGGLFILLALGTQGALTAPSDVIYTAQSGYPAYDQGMRNGSLVQINGEKISTLEELQAASDKIEVNETVDLWTSEGNFTLTAAKGPTGYDGGYMGIRVGQNTVIKDRDISASLGDAELFSFNPSSHQAFFQWFVSLLYTVGILNVLIGLFNMLPIKPLDGGLMFETVVQEFAEEKMEIVNKISLAGWALIIGSMLVSLLAGII